ASDAFDPGDTAERVSPCKDLSLVRAVASTRHHDRRNPLRQRGLVTVARPLPELGVEGSSARSEAV
ncbi:MAG TPA: hypothetical protein PKC13_23445, partial [Blastocatellia bacterium]|nr:hypothetical protein [Blastocatellia bacterium]